jgi:hypothetical protein
MTWRSVRYADAPPDAEVTSAAAPLMSRSIDAKLRLSS